MHQAHCGAIGREREAPPPHSLQINEPCCCRLERIDSQLKADRAFIGARRTHARLWLSYFTNRVPVRKKRPNKWDLKRVVGVSDGPRCQICRRMNVLSSNFNVSVTNSLNQRRPGTHSYKSCSWYLYVWLSSSLGKAGVDYLVWRRGRVGQLCPFCLERTIRTGSIFSPNELTWLFSVKWFVGCDVNWG